MLRMHLALCKMYGQITRFVCIQETSGTGRLTSEMAEVDFRSPMSTAKWLGNVWHGSHWDVHPPFGLKVVLNSNAWVQAPFQAKCLQNHFVNLILPSPLAWERPNNYSFGEVAHLE